MKHITFFLLIIISGITFSLSPMCNNEMSLDDKLLISGENIFYYYNIPLDIMNYIASFLPWETKKDFIDRSQKISRLSLNVYSGKSSAFSTINPNNCWWTECEHTDILYAPSSDNSRMGVLTIPCVTCRRSLFYSPHLAIINVKTNTKEYAQEWNTNQYQKIALSQAGDKVATIQKQERQVDQTLNYYKNMLVIHKIITKTPRKRHDATIAYVLGKRKELYRTYLPEGFEPTVVAFNKQGTSVIIHGQDYCQIPTVSTSTVFSLKHTHEDKMNVNKQQPHMLGDYFNKALVCKNFKII